MRLFLSLPEGDREMAIRVCKRLNVDNVLVSFANRTKTGMRMPQRRQFYKDRVTFLDSGGFSMQTKGKQISPIDYGKFITIYKDSFFCYANLDPEDTWRMLKNYETLTKLGLKPLPIYRQFEYKSRKYRDLLYEFCQISDYVCIGGIAVQAGNLDPDCNTFYDWVFSIASKHGTRLHGFGIAVTEYLERYPWYSIDTATWHKALRFGGGMKFDGRRVIYYFPPSQVSGREQFVEQGHKAVVAMFTNEARLESGAKAYLDLESYITKLWARKGVYWDES